MLGVQGRAFLEVKIVLLPDGERVPALGQGTWRMGENKSAHADEVAALRLGIDLGMTLIDTAEMYGEGGAEKVVADAIDGQRDRVFVVTKVYPHNASRTKLPKACERSLKRRGVSNFDLDDMKELLDIENGTACAANQVLYNLEHREIESGVLPWSQKNKIPIMAYSPVGHSRGLLKNATLKKIAKRHDSTPGQIALAWVLRQPGVIAIPKAGNQAHVRDNAKSVEIRLSDEDSGAIDREFPPPTSKESLPML